MSEHTLLLGLDLGDKMSQLAVFQESNLEAKLVATSDDNPEGYIPTSVALEGKEPIDNFMTKIRNGEPILVDGTESSPVNVLAFFFRKTLSITRKMYPTETIKQLVVTLEDATPDLIQMIYEALDKLNIQKDRAMVMSHKNCLAYYVLYQKKELWINDVGVFDYHDDMLKYYQLQLDRRMTPILVAVKERNLSEAMQTAISDDDVSKGAVFDNIVQGMIHRQILSSLYMIGEGFKADWSAEVLKRLCVGRRVFLGNNLFVSGACIAARELVESKRLEDYMLMDDDMINSTISFEAYYHAKNEEYVLVNAGEPWYQVSKEVEVIPHNEEELCLKIVNVFTKEEKKIMIDLGPVLGRTNRQCRLQIKMIFADAKTCVISIKDMGFGTLYESSNRIWEKVIELS